MVTVPVEAVPAFATVVPVFATVVPAAAATAVVAVDKRRRT
jgi:hypothetical protein